MKNRKHPFRSLLIKFRHGNTVTFTDYGKTEAGDLNAVEIKSGESV
ncbi:uncharacterized protein Dvar_57520 [Desulfosarcina variabilis str. Montpellier]